MKRVLFNLFSILIPLALLPSCVNYEPTDCNTGVKVSFSNASSTTRVDLFVFNESGLYLGTWSEENLDLSSGSITLPLRSGNYRLVAYAGLTAPYSLSPETLVGGETKFDDMRLNLSCRSDGAVTDVPGQLFHGYLPDVDVVISKAGLDTVIPLIENTNRINVTIVGLTNPEAYRLRIDDTNGDYNLDNSFATVRTIFYTSDLKKDEATSNLTGAFTVLRLKQDRKHAIITLREETSNKVLFEASLIDLLLNIGTLDFDKTHDYNIILTFDLNLNVTATINGWKVKEQSGAIF